MLFFAGMITGLPAQVKTGPPVDVVFCLDLSGSSNGLIDHFRDHLWDFWYFFSQCSPSPDFKFGIVAYARFSYGKNTGYTKVLKNLGTDFEVLSNILYRIPSRTEKGDQYVGSALNTCLKEINWSKDPSAKKIIFLVGNGDVTTGPDDIDIVVDKLVNQNIVVNAIYCKAPGEKKAINGWQTLAQKSKGKIETISLRNIYFDSPGGFDMQKFRVLNKKFNSTYLYYGKGGRGRYKIMQDADNHIYVRNTEGYRYRTLYKASPDYQRKNDSWDLVDLYYKNPVAFMDVDRKLLNDSCRKMNKTQLKSYIIYKKYERKKVSGMMEKMVHDKRQYDLVTGGAEKKMPTLDVISLEMMRQDLKGICDCKIN